MGDFFHVIGREDDTEWYEACNPTNDKKGLVPVAFFEVLGKKERNSAESGKFMHHNDTDSGYSEKPDSSVRMSQRMPGKAGGSLYGVVQYDFKAERTDELEARVGDPILIIAQSTKEWFVAKPIGRLGGPGLIPVDFIEIRDMASGMAIENKEEAIARAQIPKVEEWKKMTAEYKNSSISLKRSPQEEQEQQAARLSLQDAQSRHLSQRQSDYHGYGHDPYASMPAAISATVERWTYENDRYWYIVQAVMEDGMYRTLCRNYEDFYDLQIALLQQFPDEAGQGNSRERMLPFMPGPVAYVNASISNARRTSLDEYIKDLLMLPSYISRCGLVKKLFVVRPGDLESRSPPEPYDQRYSQNSANSSDSIHNGHNGHMSTMSNGYGQSRGHHSTHSRQISQTGIVQAQQVHMRNTADLAPPRMLRQDSSLSAQTVNSTNSASSQSFIKVKIQYNDELIAVRLPRDVSFAQLQEKLQERLGRELNVLQYRDESTGSYVDMVSDTDLTVALQRNSKLVLYAS